MRLRRVYNVISFFRINNLSVVKFRTYRGPGHLTFEGKRRTSYTVFKLNFLCKLD